VLINLKKQQMLFDIIHLLHDGVIRMGDFQVFSDELIDNVKFLQERAKVTGTYNIRWSGQKMKFGTRWAILDMKD